MPDPDRGHAVEDYARRLAGGLGVPDFVYEPELDQRGRGVREISDGLLVAGQDGVILQVKSRNEDAAKTDTAEKAAAWCQKVGRKAQSQARGRKRTLLRGSVQVRSLRGFERILPDATDWPLVVIIHHPGAPAVRFSPASDTLFMSLSDWLNLHRMIRSTAGVIAYVQRALASGISVGLGNEADRYKQLAAADLDACGTLSAFPTLPPVGLDEKDELYAALVDELIEKLADSTNAGFHPDHYLRIVEQLDRIPLIGRIRLGAKMTRTLSAMHEAKDQRSFMALSSDDPLVGDRLGIIYDYFDVAAHGPGGERFAMDVDCYAFLRQQQALETGAALDSATLAIGVLHHPQLGRRYKYAWVQGLPPPMPAAVRAYWEDQYGTARVSWTHRPSCPALSG
ncbi:hypothetical protein ACFQ1S_00250 [Kibdelosporangium lantanae]|uniref:Restriction endonuclease n=1 Tax=Kibdelosporangium lantanae TaxID=1497396 RepID=A0ABW3M0S4_9PSEU